MEKKNLNRIENVIFGIASLLRDKMSLSRQSSVIGCAYAALLVQENTHLTESELLSSIPNNYVLSLLSDEFHYNRSAIEQLAMTFSEDDLKTFILNYNDEYASAENSSPLGVCQLALKILDPGANDILLDLGSGNGNFLANVATRAKVKRIVGVEINTEAVTVSIVRSLVFNKPFEIIQGNVISQDFKHIGANKIFSHSPFGVKLNRNELFFSNTMLSQLTQKGIRVNGDWAFVLSAYHNIAQDGKAVCLMSGSGTWNTSDEVLREMMVKNGWIEGIISLPAGLLSYTNIPMTMIILSNGNKTVRMVEASNIFTPGRRVNKIEKIDVDRIMHHYRTDSEISRNVDFEELAHNEFILNPLRYVDKIDIKDAIKLGEVAVSINRGANIRSTDLDKMVVPETTGFQYLMLQNIVNGLVQPDLPNIKEIEDNLNRFCIKTKSLIISKNAPFKVAMATFKEKKVLANGNLYFMEIDSDKINPEFVEAFLQSELGNAQLEKYAKGSALRSISIQDLKEIQLPNIPKEKQDRIAEEFINLKEDLELLERQYKLVVNKKARLIEEVL